MTVLRYLFPPDEVGVGDFLLIPVIVAIVLPVAHWARCRDLQRISTRTLQRINARLDERSRR